MDVFPPLFIAMIGATVRVGIASTSVQLTLFCVKTENKKAEILPNTQNTHICTKNISAKPEMISPVRNRTSKAGIVVIRRSI